MIGISEQGGSDRVLGLIEALLRLSGTSLAGVEAIAVSRGPGSLTALRVGIGTARGLATGAGKRLVGVSSLQAVAAGLGSGAPVLALLEAGRGELYGGLFRAGLPPEPVGRERIAAPDAFARAAEGRAVRLAGNGAPRCRTLFPKEAWLPGSCEEFLAASVGRVAGALLEAARGDEVIAGGSSADLDPTPRYLRREALDVRFEE